MFCDPIHATVTQSHNTRLPRLSLFDALTKQPLVTTMFLHYESITDRRKIDVWTHALVDALLPRESAGAEERRGGVEAYGVARHGDVGGEEEERGYPHGEEALAAWLGLGLGGGQG